MSDGNHDSSKSTRVRVDKALKRCQEWSRHGQHRQIINEVEKLLTLVEDHDHLRAALLTWMAQAHLAMGNAEAALPSASQSWELEPSPHACHLTSNALEALGDVDESEKHLRLGWRLFPQAIHLPIQLAVVLSDQARMPEALDILDEIDIDEKVPDDFQIFLAGMRANLLSAMGRWAEAEEVLRDGLAFFPNSRLLKDAHEGLRRTRKRLRAEDSLATSWRDGLSALDGVSGEVDDAIVRCCAVNEYSDLVGLAARRLWRSFLDSRGVRPQSPDPWGVALVLATLEIDGAGPSIAATARSFGASPSSVRSILSRIRSFLESLDPEFRARAFAAHSNPRLDGKAIPSHGIVRSANVVPFPST